MHISWVGLVIGVVLIGLCFIAYRNIDSMGKTFGDFYSQVNRPQEMDRKEPDDSGVRNALILPIFGGIALGGGIVILSLFGVFAH